MAPRDLTEIVCSPTAACGLLQDDFLSATCTPTGRSDGPGCVLHAFDVGFRSSEFVASGFRPARPRPPHERGGQERVDPATPHGRSATRLPVPRGGHRRTLAQAPRTQSTLRL